MARFSAKKTIITNNTIMKRTYMIMLVTNILFLAICMLYKSITLFVTKSVPELLMFLYIYKISRPKYNDNKVCSGYDLSSRGLISVCFDFMYLSIFIKFMSLWTNLSYILYFMLIVSLVYEFYWRFKIHK